MFSRLSKAVVLVGALAFTGCPEKKTEAPKPPPEPPKVAVPAVLPAVAPPPTERAEKECAATIDPGPTTDIKIGDRAAKLWGAHLAFTDKDADGELTLGVVGPVNEDSGENMLALKRYVKFFQDEKVDAIVVTGDVGDIAAGITRVLKELASAKVPVLVLAGNQECRAEFTDGVTTAQKDASNVVNMNAVRVVEFPELTLISLPGYHDANYVKCSTGCRYFQTTVDEVVREAKEAKTPVALVAHGPPHGSGNQALDFAGAAGNVGDEAIAKAIAEAKIPFAFASNIKEAGGRATSDAAGTTLVKEGTASKSLFINPGPADTFGWEMNDGTKSVGMAAVFKLKGADAQWKSFRMKPLTAGEKAEAKKLAPPAREAAENK
ncbi:MAG: metallophosphoesterase [Myxococcales bacterium]|nr:metallophosphoesterase [Myxococcales bacterium]